MQLKELIIKNFKSFEYTKIPFDKGLHIVVGPNGSGKSNIVDALLFVFGATSLKRLRVDKLTNLINHHTKANTALVRAVLKNEDQEIEVSREIDKEGKSIFSLNGKKQALHEIMSYLNELGLDTDGFNTVQQGDVTKIINLNSEERRTIIDDVSGISLFDARKKEAEVNLKKVKERLDKVNIALNERKPYVEQLREEKDNAIKYKELETLENKYNYNLYKKQIDLYTQEINDYGNDLEEKEEKLNLLTIEKQDGNLKTKELDEKLEQINQELIAHSEKVQTTIGKQLSEINASKEIVTNSLNSSKNNLNYLISENNKASQELSSFVKEIDEIKIIVSNIKTKISEKQKTKDALKIDLDKNKREFEEIKAMQEELYEKLSLENKSLNEKQDLFFEKKSRLNAFSLQKENLEKQNKEIVSRVQSFTEKSKSLTEEISSLEKEISLIFKELEDKEKNLENNIIKKQTLENTLNNLKIDLSSLKKDLSSSSNITDKRKEIKEKVSDFKTFIGFLDEVISLSDSEKSFYVSYVVLKDDSEIKKILSNIDYNLSFVILSALNLGQKELASYFKNSLGSKKPSLSLKDYYFDGFSFRKILYKDTSKLESDILKIESDLKNKKEEYASLIEENSSLLKEINSFKDKKESLNISINTKKAIKQDLTEKLNEESLTKTNQTTILRVSTDISSLENEISSLENDISKISEKKESLEIKLKKFNVSINDSLRNEYDDLISEINLLEQSVISKSSDEKILQEKILNKKDYIEINTNKISKLKEEITILEDRKQDIENRLIKISNDFEEEDIKKNKLYSEKQDVSKRITEISQKIYLYDSQISDLNLSLNNLKILISTNQSKANQIEQNLKLLDLKEEDMVLMDEISLEEISSELRKVKRDKNALGNINFNAIDSYGKLAKEYDEILEKCSILSKEKEEVESMLNEINLKKKTVFIDCFNKINKEFKNIIKQMSKLLSGELVLEGDDILTSKLLINITKNGKTKDIDIMSGGEKTITALAFIFSLYAYRKAPFYILDEVDAALDDYNAGTLLNFVKELAKDTTIISVSHNGAFVSGADQIIGVTLKEHTSVIGLNLK
ncbi:AAA family ATPase [archaeon]|nr:AAA family ATPase [archaeon]NCP79175.1 AAA family ATPase [archaeon]NCP97878.1 AAA family ATPase [archaeon]NCQ06942.1 AAA family ATPase [archaeon]NCQ50738.1 AAA family ATPase [archaeon]